MFAGDLLKIGIRVSKRTVQRYMPSSRPPGESEGKPLAGRGPTIDS